MPRRSQRAGTCGRLPLTVAQILQLDTALVQAFRVIDELRHRYDAAKHIKFPPLPSIFSESLVIVASQRIFGPEWEAKYGGRECDVILEASNGDVRRVEVKATAAHGFQELKAKDLRADILVWVRFGKRFQRGTGPIEVVLLHAPGSLIGAPCRLDGVRFERLVRGSSNVRVLVFSSLEELIGTESQPALLEP